MADFEFTSDQKTAIESHSNMVITACPGSGKTSVVVEKIRREVITLKAYEGIIGITFTVKASKELNQRCKREGLDTKASFFGTIDQFCLVEIIFPFISRLYGSSENTLECKLYEDLSEELKANLSELNATRNELKTTNYNTFENDFKLLYQSGIVLLKSLGVIAVHILKNSKGCQNYIKAKYTSLYVDEYQDSSEPQHILFLGLLKLGLSAVAVGDIQQSIYAWRGGDTEYIQELINTPNVFEHHIVNLNHRCHPSITNYSNRLFDKTCLLLSEKNIRVFQLIVNGTQEDVAERLNYYIDNCINKKKASSLSGIAILVRYNNSLEFLKDGLNMSFRIFNDDPLSLINSAMTKIISSLLAYYFNDKILVNDTVELVSQYQDLDRPKKRLARSIIKNIKSCPTHTIKQQLISTAQKLLEEEIKDTEISALERVLGDKNLLKQYKPFNENEVQIMTLHKSKGLEFDVVFHLDLYDWVFPKRKFTQGCYAEKFTSWEQDLNLHFVGITRAKKYCILVTSNEIINFEGEIKNRNKSQFMGLEGLTGLFKKLT